MSCFETLATAGIPVAFYYAMVSLIFGTAAAVLLPWKTWLANPAVVHWLQEIAVHALFYGSAAALLVGLDKCEPKWSYTVYIVMYIAVLGSMSLWLAVHHHRLDQSRHGRAEA